MGIIIKDIKYENELKTGDVDWLLANVGDKIICTITFEVSDYAVASSKNPFIYNNRDGYVGLGWLTSKKPDFANFKIGDTVDVRNYVANTSYGTFTIINKQGNNAIQLNSDIPSLTPAYNNSAPDGLVTLQTPITAVRYKYNYVENSDTPIFTSKVDGTVQELIIKEVDGSNTTYFPMEFLGNKPYQIGSARIKGNGISSSPYYKTEFILEHTMFITPFMLKDQWTDIKNNTPPSYFLNNKCLRHIFEIQGGREYTDPNYLQETFETGIIGNTGWFNENFNTGLTNYTVDSVTYKRPDTTVIDAIELVATETTVEVVIKNTVDTPFSNTNTKFVLNICKAPADENEYTNNTNTLAENFLFDRKLCTLGGASVNGDNYGTDYQILKGITSTFISSSEIKITFNVAMDANVLANLNASEEARYMLWVAIQDHTLAVADADKVALLVDATDFFVDTTDPTMIDITNKYLRHIESDPATEAVNNITAFPQDEVVGYSLFYIDRNGRLTDDISFSKITLKIKAKNSITLDEFDLDTYEADLSTLTKVNTNPYVDLIVNRNFHIPTTEIRKAIRIKRRTDLDAGNKIYYETYFPFLMRWEYWEKIASANDDFFDINEPNNGLNEDWYRYSQGTNWDLYYEIIIKAKKNGGSLTFTKETIINTTDYDTNALWETESIRAYDTNNIQLYDGVNLKNYLLGYAKTRIEAKMTKTSGTVNLADIVMVLDIETFEQGGVNGRRRISSMYEHDSDTWFESVDGTKKVKLSLSGNTVTGEALINNTELPFVEKFKITARLYEKQQAGKLFQDGNEFNFEDGSGYNFQDQ
jgi:hypothetical protein